MRSQASKRSATANFPNTVNLGDGLDHPGDLAKAKSILGKLHRGGYKLNPVAIRKWAMRHNWDPGSARQLAKVVKQVRATARN